MQRHYKDNVWWLTYVDTRTNNKNFVKFVNLSNEMDNQSHKFRQAPHELAR